MKSMKSKLKMSNIFAGIWIALMVLTFAGIMAGAHHHIATFLISGVMYWTTKKDSLKEGPITNHKNESYE